MIAELIKEDRISKKEVAESLKVSQQTIAIWMKVGVRGQRLESFLLGGRRRYTTQQAVTRFLAAINGDGKSLGPEV